MSNRNFPELSEENLARFFKARKVFREENTPFLGNKCKAENCGGDVVREVSGWFNGAFLYRTAACRKCGRQYLHAGDDVPKVGEKEFIEMMNTPFTI